MGDELTSGITGAILRALHKDGFKHCLSPPRWRLNTELGHKESALVQVGFKLQ